MLQSNEARLRVRFAMLVVVVSCVIAVGWMAAKDFAKPAAQPAKTYPLHDEHSDEKVAAAVDAYDSPEKAQIFNVKWNEEGFLPIFLVISNDSELICLTRRDGRVRWVEELPRYEDLKKKKGSLTWSGPVLGGDRLIVVASNGEAMSFSPYTGAALGRVELPDGTFLTPIIANETLYVLTDEADLIAMR